MVQSPSWEANWFAATQKIPRILRNPNVHYRTHKRINWINSRGQPTRGGRPAWGLDEVLTTPLCKKTLLRNTHMPDNSIIISSKSSKLWNRQMSHMIMNTFGYYGACNFCDSWISVSFNIKVFGYHYTSHCAVPSSILGLHETKAEGTTIFRNVGNYSPVDKA